MVNTRQTTGGNRYQGIYAHNRYDDQPLALDEMENLLLLEVRNYFMIRWSRHYKKFDESKLMNRLQHMIRQAILDGKIPGNLNLAYYVPAHIYFSEAPIPLVCMEAHLIAVGTFLQEKMAQPERFRAEEYRREIRERIGPMPRKKVRKLKKSRRTGEIVNA